MHVARRPQLGDGAVLVLDVVLGEAHLAGDLARELLVEVLAGAHLLVGLLGLGGAVHDAERGRRRVVVLVGRLGVGHDRRRGVALLGGRGGVGLVARGLEQARDEALRDPSLAEVVDEDGLHDAQAVDVEALEDLDAAQVLAGDVPRRVVAAELGVDARAVLGLGEEEVVVDVGVGRGGLVRVDGRDVAARDRDGAASGGRDKVGLGAREEALAEEALVHVVAREVEELAELVVPVARGRELVGRRRRREEVRRLGAERVGDVLRRAHEPRRGRDRVRDGERGDEVRLAEVAARRLGDEGGEAAAE